MWMTEEQLEKQNLDKYLHGHCDEWVLEHFRDGDVAIIWNEYNEYIGETVLIHCYIKRDNLFVDVRGETLDETLITDGFDYGPDDDKIFCHSLDEYKWWIQKICHYKDKKWKQ